jgi:hypothetical protein
MPLAAPGLPEPQPFTTAHVPTHSMMTRTRDGTIKPKSFSEFKLYYSTKHHLLAFHSIMVPSCLPHLDTSLKPLNPLIGSKLCMRNLLYSWQIKLGSSVIDLLEKNIITNKWVY